MKCDKCKGDLSKWEDTIPHDCVGNLVARVQQLEGELEMATTCLHCDYGEDAALCSCSQQTLDRFKELVARVAELEKHAHEQDRRFMAERQQLLDAQGRTAKVSANNTRLREAIEERLPKFIIGYVESNIARGGPLRAAALAEASVRTLMAWISLDGQEDG
jgi:hypothetical protein